MRAGEWPLTYSDYRLIGDLCDIAGERHPADQALVLALLVARDEGALRARGARCHGAAVEPVWRTGRRSHGRERIARRLAELLRRHGSTARPTMLPATDRRDRRAQQAVYFQRYYLAASQLRERVQERLNDAQPSIQGDCQILRQVVREAPQRLSSGNHWFPAPIRSPPWPWRWPGVRSHREDLERERRPPSAPSSAASFGRACEPTTSFLAAPSGRRPADDRGPHAGIGSIGAPPRVTGASSRPLGPPPPAPGLQPAHRGLLAGAG